MDFLEFWFKDGFHYFGIIFGMWVFLTLIRDIVVGVFDALTPKCNQFNYVFPNITKLGKDFENDTLTAVKNMKVVGKIYEDEENEDEN